MQTGVSRKDSWTTFETSIGVCGMSWVDGEVTAFLLPERTIKEIQRKLVSLTGKKDPMRKKPLWVSQLIHQIVRHLAGSSQDFSKVPLDLHAASEFRKAVYIAARKIPAGQLKTYKELASAMNRPSAARAVGQALGKNPIALLIPCHRIVASGGRAGGFSAFGGSKTKAKLLDAEGVLFKCRSADGTKN